MTKEIFSPATLPPQPSSAGIASSSAG